MPYYRPCPECGASLDPGERCDCVEKERAALMTATSGRQDRYYEHKSNPPKVYKTIGVVSSMKRF